MPRNSTGNYTLPLPPVVSGELIEAAWANTTLDDIGQALTESLDRYGRGGMLAPFLFTDGTVSNPGAAWANAPGTGFFRDSNHLGFVWNGAEQASFNANGMAGKIESMRVIGSLSIDYGARLAWKSDAAIEAWRIDIDTAENLYIYNVTLGAVGLVMQAGGYSQFDTPLGAKGFQTNGDWSGIQFYDTSSTKTAEIFGRPDGGMTMYAWSADGTSASDLTILFDKMLWSRVLDVTGSIYARDLLLLGSGDYGLLNGYDDGGIYRLRFRAQASLWGSPYGEMLLSSDGWLLLNNVGLSLPSSSAVIGGSMTTRGGTFNESTSGIYSALINNGAGNPGVRWYWGGVGEWDLSLNSSQALAFTAIGAGEWLQLLFANGELRSRAIMTDQTNAFSWYDTSSQERFTIKSIGGWAGIEWHMPSVAYMGIYQVSDGALRWLASRDIAAPVMQLFTNGSLRAKQFVATPAP